MLRLRNDRRFAPVIPALSMTQRRVCHAERRDEDREAVVIPEPKHPYGRHDRRSHKQVRDDTDKRVAF